MSEEAVKTVPPDARFPNQNVTRWCFSSFVDFQKCCRLLGEGSSCCEQFAKIYKSVCPNEWVSRWESQLQIGTFPVDLPSATNDCEDIK